MYIAINKGIISKGFYWRRPGLAEHRKYYIYIILRVGRLYINLS